MQRTIKRQVYMISCPDLPVWMNTRISRVAPVSVSLSKSRSRWHKTLTSVPDSCGAWWCTVLQQCMLPKNPAQRTSLAQHAAAVLQTCILHPNHWLRHAGRLRRDQHMIRRQTWKTLRDNTEPDLTNMHAHLETLNTPNTHGWVQVLVGLSI